MHWLNISHVILTAIKLDNNDIRLLSPMAVVNISLTVLCMSLVSAYQSFKEYLLTF